MRKQVEIIKEIQEYQDKIKSLKTELKLSKENGADIVNDVTDSFGMTFNHMTKCKKQKNVFAISTSVYILKNLGFNHSEIGKLINKDRTTVIYHCTGYDYIEHRYNYFTEYQPLADVVLKKYL